MTSVVLVDTGGTVVEYVTAEEDPQQVGWTQTQTRITPQLQSTTRAFIISVFFTFLLFSLPQWLSRAGGRV